MAEVILKPDWSMVNRVRKKIQEKLPGWSPGKVVPWEFVENTCVSVWLEMGYSMEQIDGALTRIKSDSRMMKMLGYRDG